MNEMIQLPSKSNEKAKGKVRELGAGSKKVQVTFPTSKSAPVPGSPAFAFPISSASSLSLVLIGLGLITNHFGGVCEL